MGRNWAWLACLGHLRFGISARCSCWPSQAEFLLPPPSSFPFPLLLLLLVVVAALLYLCGFKIISADNPFAANDVVAVCGARNLLGNFSHSVAGAVTFGRPACVQRGPEIGLGKLCGQAKHDGRLPAPQDTVAASSP